MKVVPCNHSIGLSYVSERQWRTKMGMEMQVSSSMKRRVYELLRAMLCNLSWNFRAVWLEEINSRAVILRFLLDHDDEADREAISDIVTEFEAQQDTRIDLSLDIQVSPSPQAPHFGDGYLVYARWGS